MNREYARLVAEKLSSLWCDWTHGGGDMQRDDQGRINWRCRKCGRWSDSPVSLEDERAMTARAVAARFASRQAAIDPQDSHD